MAELYLFDQDDNFLNILTEEEGLVDTWFKDYQNHIEDEFFVFNIDSNSELLKYIVEENQVAFYDRDNDLRLVRMKDLREVTTSDGGFITHEIRVICEPSFLELHDHFIEDRRIKDGTAQTALNRALEGSRYIGEVTVDLGLATDNFYWIDGIEAVFKILNTWGGALKDTITLDENNKIIERKLWIVQRLGTDNGLIVEPDYNAESISRNTLSYPETALWGQGASLEIEDEEGEHTGGYTRYITFEDVEWKKSKGDPVDKPKGQKWVGDPQALELYGYLDNGVRMHREGHFSNQDYEDPEELLWATWNELQERKLKEITHEATIYESDKKVSLGDTVTILSRNYNKPIELQSQITGLEYDLLEPEEVTIIVGKFVDMNEDPLQKEIDDLKEDIRKPRPTKPIDSDSFPDIKPPRPVNLYAVGGIEVIQLYWDYDDELYIKHYEVYGSQVKDFVPDSQHLLWRGRVSSFAHTVGTDQKWYYQVRAVNYHERPSEWSGQVEASTVRVMSDDILFGEDIAAELRELSKTAELLADGTIDYSKLGQDITLEIDNARKEASESVEKANLATANANEAIQEAQTAFDDAQEALETAGSALDLSSINRADMTTLSKMVDENTGEISTINQSVQGLQTVVSDAQGNASSALQIATGLQTTVSDIEGNVSTLQQTATNLTSRIDNLQIGGRNLIKGISNNFSSNRLIPYKGSTLIVTENVSVEEWGATDATEIRASEGDGTSLLKVYKQISASLLGTVAGETYTFSVYVKNLRPDRNLTVHINGFDGRPEVTLSGGESRRVVITGTRSPGGFQIQFRAHNVGFYAHFIVWRDQIEIGEYATDWSPAPEDTDQKFSVINQTIDSIASRVQNTEGDISTVTQLANGLQNRVRDAEGNISTVTQLANALQTDLRDAKGNINTLTETASSMQRTIKGVRDDLDGLEIGGTNLVSNKPSAWGGSSTKDFRADGSIYLSNPNQAEWGNFTSNKSIEVTPGESLTFSFQVLDINKTIKVQFRNTEGGTPTSYKNATIPNKKGKFVHTYKNMSNESIFISPWITLYANDGTNDGTQFIHIKHIKVEKGNKASDWSPAVEDMATQSQISQLSDNINLRVTKKDLINQINIDTTGILIAGQKIHITGQTKIDNGVIKNAHISDAAINSAKIANLAVGTAAIANGAITRAKLGTAVIGTAQIADAAITKAKIGNAVIDTAHIANGAITNAKIASLRADKIDGGVINGNSVTIRVTNGTQELKLDHTGLRSIDNSGRDRIHLGVRNLAGKGQSDPSTLRFFSGNGSVSAGIGMNVNDTFVIGSSASSMAMELYSGKNTIMYAAQIRFKPNNTSDGEYARFASVLNSSGTAREVAFQPNTSGHGYIGSSGYRWWRTYVNYVHYIDLVNLSTRDSKANIQEADIKQMQFAFDEMDLVTFNYKNEDGTPRTDELKVGWIAEDSPSLITSKDKKQISLNNIVGVIAGSLKHQTSRVNQLEDIIERQALKIAKLEERINKLEVE